MIEFLTLIGTITMFSNQIQTLPLSLTQCVNVERLHLGNNKIEYLPPEIFAALTNLRELYVHKNKIQTIPPEIGNLRSKFGIIVHPLILISFFF